jgi:sugar O-acyltransferase (sialic acid O-acetyltransferase NeuD family)
VTIRLIVVGAGGFGRETLDVIEAINGESRDPAFDVLGVVDSHPSDSNLDLLRRMGVSWLGSEAEWLARGEAAQYLVAIGNPLVREQVAQRFDAAGLDAAVAVHPRASVGSLPRFGAGTIICAGAQISTNIVLGKHVHVNPSATIGHDSVLSNFVSVNPGAVISGDVAIQRGTLVGAGAVVLQGLSIGEYSIVGAGACVVRDVDPGRTVKGIPAR